MTSKLSRKMIGGRRKMGDIVDLLTILTLTAPTPVFPASSSDHDADALPQSLRFYQVDHEKEPRKEISL